VLFAFTQTTATLFDGSAGADHRRRTMSRAGRVTWTSPQRSLCRRVRIAWTVTWPNRRAADVRSSVERSLEPSPRRLTAPMITTNGGSGSSELDASDRRALGVSAPDGRKANSSKPLRYGTSLNSQPHERDLHTSPPTRLLHDAVVSVVPAIRLASVTFRLRLWAGAEANKLFQPYEPQRGFVTRSGLKDEPPKKFQRMGNEGHEAIHR
jgi:hypothetical protein